MFLDLLSASDTALKHGVLRIVERYRTGVKKVNAGLAFKKRESATLRDSTNPLARPLQKHFGYDRPLT